MCLAETMQNVYEYDILRKENSDENSVLYGKHLYLRILTHMVML